jgi:inorganic pyrophosphatase
VRLTDFPIIDPKSGAVRVIVETPRGSRNKFKYLPELDVFSLDRLLPVGSVFPFDFGFVPSTLAEDGDPLDVLVLTDEPVSMGCLILVRLIGVIRATQRERAGKGVRNDRLIGVSLQAVAFRAWKTLQSADNETIRAIEQFFISYHTVQGRTFRPLSRGGPEEAKRLLARAVNRAGNGGDINQ